MVKAGIGHHVEEEEETEVFPKLREALGLGPRESEAASSGDTKEDLYDQANDAGVEGRSSMSKGRATGRDRRGVAAALLGARRADSGRSPTCRSGAQASSLLL